MQLRVAIQFFIFIYFLYISCTPRIDERQKVKQENIVFILFDFYQQEQKGNILAPNFMEKRFGKDEVTFTRGLETNGYIDKFICTATENYELSLEKCCFEEKKAIPVKELKVEELKNKKIILVEITPKKDTIVYKAKWQRLYFEE